MVLKNLFLKFKMYLLAEVLKKQEKIDAKLDTSMILFSKQLIEMNLTKKVNNIIETEFKVFSQWGEDGIIQYLINKLPINNKVFIEFGVENYKESNTRFLLINNNWSGFVIDGDKENVEMIKNDEIYWKYDIVAENHFITKDNINDIISNYLKQSDFFPNIGLLSIDIDGNDYFIWKEINVINPDIVICEYNWIFGDKEAVSVPYDKTFYRTDKHFSNLYFGASLPALIFLANQKGYSFIGTNSTGNDAFFVKKELAEKYLENIIKNIDNYEFVSQKCKESRDDNGNLTYIRGQNRRDVISEMPVIDVVTNKIKKIKDLSI